MYSYFPGKYSIFKNINFEHHINYMLDVTVDNGIEKDFGNRLVLIISYFKIIQNFH